MSPCVLFCSVFIVLPHSLFCNPFCAFSLIFPTPPLLALWITHIYLILNIYYSLPCNA
nr:MAG TPA: hypothetical protein [Caudoviricetes sp.]